MWIKELLIKYTSSQLLSDSSRFSHSLVNTYWQTKSSILANQRFSFCMFRSLFNCLLISIVAPSAYVPTPWSGLFFEKPVRRFTVWATDSVFKQITFISRFNSLSAGEEISCAFRIMCRMNLRKDLLLIISEHTCERTDFFADHISSTSAMKICKIMLNFLVSSAIKNRFSSLLLGNTL